MKWNILGKGTDIIDILLKNRKITDKKEFLNPKFPEFKLSSTKAIIRIKKAIKNSEPIIVYGDYDADGICGTAIIWEALHGLGAKVMPFIPSREKEGYGLSVEGIKDLDARLIITVDNGIVAHEVVDYANKKGIDVIILDHHEKPKKLPKAYAIVHTTKLCASGIAYFFAREMLKQVQHDTIELAAIATVTDMMPLVGINRSIVKFGLESLNKTKRVGLKSIFETAGIEKVGVYEIGFMVGPRLNASGRIESALTALRLLCTHNKERAKELAQSLNSTNEDRQTMTSEMTLHAKGQTKIDGKIIVTVHDSYHQGVIGLIAGKLVEQYYLPAIVIAKGETVSKASARSISGFNIIEAIRKSDNLLINAGGHPMAAGFSIETSNITKFKLQILEYANKMITDEMLEKKLKIDMSLDLKQINMDLYNQISKLEPYGNGNPEPVFSAEAIVDSIRTVGTDGKHLKFTCHPELVSGSSFGAIAFNQGELFLKIRTGDKISFAYSLALDTYNGGNKLQLKIKDIIR